MPNPFRAQRPNPIDPDYLSDGGSLDDLLTRSALRTLLHDNFEWLSHTERSTREIYAALFRHVDYSGSRAQEGMEYLREALWALGFRTVGEKPHPVNPTWKWVEAA